MTHLDVSDAMYNARRHLRDKHPKAYEIRAYVCEVCGSHHATSFLLPDWGMHRFFYCTTCGTYAGNAAAKLPARPTTAA